MNYELILPGRVIHEKDGHRRIGELVAPLGAKVMLVHGVKAMGLHGRLDACRRSLKDAGLDWCEWSHSGEPSCRDVEQVASDARENGCDVVLAIGGGSVLDLAKAVAALVPNGEKIRPYLEGVGDGLRLEKDPLPFVAVPTTAGTGSEATRNAVIGTQAEGFKMSLRDVRLLPRVALVDPGLALETSAEITVPAALDAMTQLLEALVSRRATEPIRALCLSGLEQLGKATPLLLKGEEGVEHRSRIAYAATLSGVALSHAGLGSVHALASPLGGRAGLPHAAVCAALLPHAIEQNRRLLRKGHGVSGSLVLYEQAEQRLGSTIEGFLGNLRIPRLGELGLHATMIPEIAKDSKGGNRDANPVELGDDDLAELLRSAL